LSRTCCVVNFITRKFYAIPFLYKDVHVLQPVVPSNHLMCATSPQWVSTICTRSRQITASASTNQGPERENLILLRGLVVRLRGEGRFRTPVARSHLVWVKPQTRNPKPETLSGFGYRVSGFKFRVWGFGRRVQGAGSRVQGAWSSVQGIPLPSEEGTTYYGVRNST